MPYPFELLFKEHDEYGTQSPATWQIHIHQDGCVDASGACAITRLRCTEDEIDKGIDSPISQLNGIRQETIDRYHAWHETHRRQMPLAFKIG